MHQPQQQQLNFDASSFKRYPLTESQQISGSILNTFQLMNLQNIISDYAEQLINTPFTPNDPLSYAQFEAECKGKILVLKMLINESVEAEKQAQNLTTKES